MLLTLSTVIVWPRSHGDAELDGGKRDPRDGRAPASLGLLERDQAVGGQRLDIRVDVFEIAADEPGELVDRVRPALADRAEQLEPLGREDLSGGLQAREVGSLSGGDLLSRSHGLPGGAKFLQSLFEGLDLNPALHLLSSFRPALVR